MRRRTLVVLVSAVTLLGIAIVVLATIGVGVGTDPGREQIRGFIQRQLAGRVNGTLHIGKVSGGLLRGFTIDSFAIRGPDDSILVSTGKVTLQYDPRDLLDRRILLRNVEVEHPVIHLRQHASRDWNFQRIFKSDGPSAPGMPGREFGDFVMLDSVRVKNGTFLLTRPWHPDDTLTGAKRDSAIRRNLENPSREIRRSAEGLTHTYRWSRITAFLPRARIAHPDSGRFGQEFVVQDLRVEEQEPPFSFRNARGIVRKLGDSIFTDIRHFDLPASTGSAIGKIWWGSDLPIRVDVRVDADSVSLRDVAWVYETLPREGSGRTKLRIRNYPANLDDFQYELTEMDVRSTNSRVTGAMTFVVGGPVLIVKDVDLRGSPVNFDLLRTFAGEPFSVDWQGDLIGHVKGPGGPLTDFVVDESDVTWRDTHVRGAVSRFSGSGGLDILEPEFTKFHDFDVSVGRLDLRSIEYLFPEFLRLGGTVAGTVTLDSSWLDVRFSNANVTHRNGPGDPSRVTGAGRVTWGEEFMLYDLDVKAEPVSLAMMSRAYPLGLKGLMSGPVRAKGTTDSLDLKVDLQGPAGRITYEGLVDAYPLSVAAFGRGRAESLNFAQLIDRPNAPAGWLTGGYNVAVRVDTSDLSTLQGSAALALERGEFDGTRVFPSRFVARFADGRMYVDTLRIESVAASVTASGALGLSGRFRDSLHYHIAVDSLGGLRPYIARLTAGTAMAQGVDSLAGTVSVLGVARGSLESLDVSGRLVGANMFLRREAGRDVIGEYAISDVLRAPTGAASIRFQTLNVGVIALDTLGLSVRLEDGRTGVFSVGALARNGAKLSVSGDMAIHPDRNDIVVRDVALLTDSSRWSLGGPAHITTEGLAFSIDSLVLARNRGGGRIRLSGVVPDTGHARILFRADSVPLYDVGYIAQLRRPMSGFANVTMQGAGTKESPVMNLQATLSQARYGGLQAQVVRAGAEYRNNRADVSLDLARGGKDALFARGSLPIALSYFGAQLLDDSLRATIRTDQASFDIVEALVPGLNDATGNLVANLDVAGTWKHPEVTGALKVENGEVTVEQLGVRARGVQVDLALFGVKDSLAIRRMVGWSGATPADSVSIRGHITYRRLDNPVFGLRMDARTFHALEKRTLANLDVSTEPNGVRLSGPLSMATLTGGLIVDRGAIFLPDPELARKQRVDLTFGFADTSARSREALPQPSSRLMESLLLNDVRVTLGDEVWLRSREANIKLGGSLTVARVRERRTNQLAYGNRGDDTVRYVPKLDGELRAERGTYTLVLTPVLQREFQVEGGTITFFPVVGLDPELNISAMHTVRTQTGAGSSDLRIRVRLTGPLPSPVVSLESAESFALSQSDLVSYLIFGQPNFELADASQNTLQLAAQTLFPSAQSWATNSLRGLLGSRADIVQLHPGTADASKWAGEGTQLDAFYDFLWSTRVGTEKQLSENVFVSLSTGICQLSGVGSSEQSAWEGWRESLSGKIEWRLSRDASIKAGKEPSGTLVCRPGSSMGRIVDRPSQWGLSLFKTWRF